LFNYLVVVSDYYVLEPEPEPELELELELELVPEPTDTLSGSYE